MHTYIHKRIYISIHASMHASTHACMHTYMHIHAHIHACIQRRSSMHSRRVIGLLCSVSGTAVDVCPMSDSPRCEKSEGGMTAAANVAPPRMPRSAERYMRSEAESGRRRIAVAAAVSGRRSCRRARCASGTRRAPAWVQLHQLGWHSTAWARTASSVYRSNVGVSCQLRRAGAVHADHEHPSHTQAHTHTHLQLDWRRVDAGG